MQQANQAPSRSTQKKIKNAHTHASKNFRFSKLKIGEAGMAGAHLQSAEPEVLLLSPPLRAPGSAASAVD